MVAGGRASRRVLHMADVLVGMETQCSLHCGLSSGIWNMCSVLQDGRSVGRFSYHLDLQLSDTYLVRQTRRYQRISIIVRHWTLTEHCLVREVQACLCSTGRCSRTSSPFISNPTLSVSFPGLKRETPGASQTRQTTTPDPC
jgi:hypothetical protein